MADVIEKAIPIFDHCHFTSKKAMEYPLWRELAFLVRCWYKKKNRPTEVLWRMEEIDGQLKRIKHGVLKGVLDPLEVILIDADIHNSRVRVGTEEYNRVFYG